MAKPTKNVKENILPHSKAKLELFQSYLSHYYRVLSLSNFITRINIYDVFCGAGLYQDSEKGSALRSIDVIKGVNGQLQSLGRTLKPTTLQFNDGDPKRIKSVELLLSSENVPNLQINYFNKSADLMLEEIIAEVNSKSSKERSLVFIDPYGYSEIKKQRIVDLLANGYTEIVLFLPIMQMHRFVQVALNDDQERKCYDNLKNFIHEFFSANHRIFNEKLDNAIEFIYELKEAFTFGGEYFSCSYYIEREKGNYYAVFFITSNLYGLEKMIEAKQKLDPNRGKGYDKQKLLVQNSLFGDLFKEEDRRRHLNYLKELLLKELRSKPEGLTNCDVYYLAVTNKFRPTNANAVVKELIKEQRIIIFYVKGQSPTARQGFYIDYEHYKNQDIQVTFKSKIHGTITH